MPNQNLDFNYQYGFSVPEKHVFKAKKGLNKDIVKQISSIKKEPLWMKNFRLKAYQEFIRKPMPRWGADLSKINFNDIFYYIKPTDSQKTSWEDLPKEIKDTYDKIGVPEAEKKFLAGVSAQYESEVVYESIQKELTRQGVIFCDMDTGLRKYPEIVKKYFRTVISLYDNKFASLNSAVWSGGSFVYIPKGVKVTLPLQAYFRINAQNFGQFERTLIIAEEGSFVHYVEGCLPAGEKISLGGKWVNIEAVKPGDFVVTHNGTLSKVKAIMTRKYKGKLYRIFPLSPFNNFALTEEHPVFSIKREKVLVKRKVRNSWLPETSTKLLLSTKPEFIPVKELKKGDFVIFPKIKKFLVSDNLTQDQVEFLGFYTAEGSAYFHKKLKQYIVTLCFSEKEKEYINRVSILIKKITGKKAILVNDKKKHAVSVLVYSKELYDLCLVNCGKLAKEKKLSSQIMNLPKDKLSLFFWSYFKGDGNYHIKKGGSQLYRTATVSIALATQLQEILGKMGIFASIQQRKGGDDVSLGRKIKRSDQYILAFTKPKIWSEVRETDDYFIVPIKKIIKSDFNNYVFNIEVEGANSYLVKGAAVHNCTAPIYTSSSLHAAVVEIIVKKNARVRYTTVQNWSKNVYNLVTKRAKVYENGVMEWVDCNIGCLPKGTKIFTTKGVKDISEIVAGDKVFAYDFIKGKNDFYEVKAKVDNGIRDTFLLKTKNFRIIEATNNHPFFVLKKLKIKDINYYCSWKQLKDIKVGDYIAIQQKAIPYQTKKIITFKKQIKGLKNKINLPKVLDADWLWFLGIYLGDGYLEFNKNKRPRRLYLAIPRTDKIRKKLINFINFKLKSNWKEKGICVTINSVLLVEFIESLGFGRYAKNKLIPPWVWTLSLKERLSFLRGYIESDGYIRKNKMGKFTQIIISSSNKKLLEDIKLLMISCGLNPLKINSYIKLRSLNKGKEKIYKSYYLSLNYEENKKIFDFSFAKKELLADGFKFVKVISIEKKGKQPVFDLEIKKVSNFFANGILVHNSKLTMKYPACYLVGEGARGEVLSIAYSGGSQHQDAGAKMIHLAPNTTSRIISKSISKDGGRTSYRGLVQISPEAKNSRVYVSCDALIIDEKSRSDTYPEMRIKEKEVDVQHEATVEKLGEETLFYLASRGISKTEAEGLLVNGFIEPVTKEIPLEYSIELNRLINLEMAGSVG